LRQPGTSPPRGTVGAELGLAMLSAAWRTL
jgi:hypothetical protein